MAMNNSNKQARSMYTIVPFGTVAGCGIALASVCFLILTLSGTIGLFTEWQFAQMGYYSPLAPIVLLTIVFSAIGYALVWLSRSRISVPVAREDEKLYTSGKQWRHVFLSTAFASSLFALMAAIHLLFLPSALGTPELISANGFELLKLKEGPVVLNGFTAKGEMVRFTRGFLGWQQDIYLVPLATRDSINAPACIFAQVSESAAMTSMPFQFAGILQHDALPDELLPFGNIVGKHSSPRPAVIFLDQSSMTYGHILTLLTASLIALIAAAAGWFFGREAPPSPNSASEPLHAG